MSKRLSNKVLYGIIGLVAISMVGLVVIQFQWLKSAILVNEQQFNERVSNAVQAVEINHGANLSAYVSDSGNSKLKSYLKEEFAKSKLPTDFKLSLYDEQDRKIICDAGDGAEVASITLPFACSHLMAIHFPTKRTVLLSQLAQTLAPTILFILSIVACFTYVIIVLRRQKKLSEIKSDFINNLTHEFKTPLSSIALTNRMIRDRSPQRFDEKDRSYFQIIEQESVRLNSQIDKILQMAQIEAGIFTLEKIEINIHALIEHVSNAFQPRLKELNGQVHLEMKAERPVMKGDELHLTNLILNLLDNACKYANQAPIITIRTANTEAGICISIKDNGIGIKKEIQKHIFDKFYRAQTGDVHDTKGFGLGLSYVKGIVLAHNGKINLTSEIDKGSEFEVILPVV